MPTRIPIAQGGSQQVGNAVRSLYRADAPPTLPDIGHVRLDSDLPVLSIGALTRGPTGQTQAPFTPPWGTAYTHVANTQEELASIVAAQRAVTTPVIIEMRGDIDSLDIPDHADHRARAADNSRYNIFIRPPIGERRVLGAINLDASAITLGGFNVRGRGVNLINALAVRGSRSGTWRCTSDHILNGEWRVQNNEGQDNYRQFHVEACAPRGTFRGGDRIQYTSANGGARRMSSMVNCYWATNFTGVLPYLTHPGWPGKGPTYQWTNPGHPIYFNGWKATGEFDQGSGFLPAGVDVTVPPPDKTYDYRAEGTPHFAIQAWTDRPRYVPLSVEVRVNGTLVGTAVFRGPDYEQGLKQYWNDVAGRPAVHRLWTPEDVVTIRPLSDVTGLHVVAGVDAGAGGTDAGGPDHHGDLMQFFGATSTAFTLGFTALNTVFCGVWSNGIAQMNNHVGGEFFLDNCFFGHQGGGGFWGDPADATKGGDYFGTMRFYMTRNTWGSQARLSNRSMPVFKFNDYGSEAAPGGTILVPDSTNTNRGSTLASPSPPNLATLWPECPYTPNGGTWA